MQKKLLILIIFATLLTACGIKATPTVNTPTTSSEPSATGVAETEEPNETSGPSQTPAPSVVNVELPVTVSDYAEFLSAGAEAGVFHVEFDPNRGNALQLDRPHMPTYT